MPSEPLRVLLALAAALIVTGCSPVTDNDSIPTSSVPDPVRSIAAAQQITEIDVEIDLRACKLSPTLRGQIAGDQRISGGESEVDEWIEANPDRFHELCLAWWVERQGTPPLTIGTALRDTADTFASASDTYVTGELRDPELVFCLSSEGFALVQESAGILRIGPSVLAEEIRFTFIVSPPRTLTAEEVLPHIKYSWDSWYSLRPDYFIRSCRAAYEAFGGEGSG